MTKTQELLMNKDDPLCLERAEETELIPVSSGVYPHQKYEDPDLDLGLNYHADLDTVPGHNSLLTQNLKIFQNLTSSVFNSL